MNGISQPKRKRKLSEILAASREISQPDPFDVVAARLQAVQDAKDAKALQASVAVASSFFFIE